MKLLNWSCQKIHCSVDDTLWIFKDLTEHKEYVSIFENPILNKIKEYDTIIIHRHIRPDGDCIGSQRALKEAIKLNFPNKNGVCGRR